MTFSTAPVLSAEPSTLDFLSLPSDQGGVIIGSGDRGEPISAAFFREKPTKIALVGSLYLAQQCVLRSIAVGATVIVATGRPAAWQHVVNVVNAPHHATPSIQLQQLGPIPPAPASDDAPLLTVVDGGPTPQNFYTPRVPWHTTLYLLPHLHPQAREIPVTADLALTQRLTGSHAEFAGRTWRLPAHMTRQLTTLKDDHMIALGANLWRPVRIVTTPREHQLLTQPHHPPVHLAR